MDNWDNCKYIQSETFLLNFNITDNEKTAICQCWKSKSKYTQNSHNQIPFWKLAAKINGDDKKMQDCRDCCWRGQSTLLPDTTVKLLKQEERPAATGSLPRHLRLSVRLLKHLPSKLSTELLYQDSLWS